jgi:hypothetical protein
VHVIATDRAAQPLAPPQGQLIRKHVGTNGTQISRAGRLTDEPYKVKTIHGFQILFSVMAASNWRTLLNVPLFPPALTRAAKQALISCLWPSPTASCDDVDNFDAYFQYMNEECRSEMQSGHSIRTIVDLVDITDCLKSNTTIPMSELRNSLKHALPHLGNDTPKLSASIELAVRLWLMINVRNLMPNDPRTLQTALPWPDNSSLEVILKRQTLTSGAVPSGTRPLIPDTVNAFEIERITSYRIVWTDDFLSHLLLDGRAIYLYYHVSVLKRIEESGSW